MLKEMCYVIDLENKPLSPTNYNKGCYLVRKKRAKIVSRLPFVIQLNKIIENIDDNLCIIGIDTGAKYTGLALVEQCNTKNKVLFKGTLNHPQDVKKKMELRRGERRYRRSHKRYRKARFNNRASSRRIGRLPNSIKCNKDEILKVIDKLSKFLRINLVIIEDVQIDIRRLVDGKNVYKWQYQKSNRLDNNIRLATLIRDNNTCMMCSCKNTAMEVHHIKPRKFNGADILSNLITLCKECHKKVTSIEEQYEKLLYAKINGKNINTKDSMRAMQGKTYLKSNIECSYLTQLTYGCDTANKRQDWNIKKSHSNDAIVITGLQINQNDCEVKDWQIKPLRSKKKNKVEEVEGFRHRDYVSYLDSKNILHKGYVTAMYVDKKQINVQTHDKHLKRCGYKRCKLIQRPKSIIFA